MPSRIRPLACATLLSFGLAAAPAAAATFTVDDDRAQCPGAAFEAIQPAVDASGPGDTVLVCPGAYPGGVEIAGAEHSGLRLRGQVTGRAAITGVGIETDPYGVLVSSGARGVEVSRLVVQGPAASPRFDRVGVLVLGEAHASRIRDNRIDGSFSAGIDIRGGEATDISRNVVTGYEDAGIVFQGQVGVVSRNRTASTSDVGSGIYAFGFGTSALVAGNRTSGEGHGLGFFLENTVGGDVEFRHNVARDHDIGAVLNDAVGTRFEYNTLTDNRIGIFALPSAVSNRIDHNTALRNRQADCRDDSRFNDDAMGRVQNVWVANRGFTAEPFGICRAGNPGAA